MQGFAHPESTQASAASRHHPGVQGMAVIQHEGFYIRHMFDAGQLFLMGGLECGCCNRAEQFK